MTLFSLDDASNVCKKAVVPVDMSVFLQVPLPTLQNNTPSYKEDQGDTVLSEIFVDVLKMLDSVW